MFPTISFILVFVAILQSHAHSVEAYPQWGFVSRTSFNGDRTALSSINNAKVGVSHNQRYPYIPSPLWLPAYGSSYRLPIGIRPRPFPVNPARPFYPGYPLRARPYPQRPYVEPSRIAGRNSGLGGLLNVLG
ncbi:uncharacterized protein [Parasteatoda tepidariorum]|uniref:uncharacterized protein n=1 Tax=Parasteatoda tepidariorum TaxID=114398 RepID=UPI00077FA4C7|nr:uncharacterized protein LOC107456914 [Parasteatoda tepidariorum]